MAADRTITIRPGTPADVDDGLTVLNLADLERDGGTVPGEGHGDRARRRLTDPGTFFFVAEGEGDGLLGIAAGLSGRERGGTGAVIPGLCHISMVAVRPGHWGRGLGTRLVRAVISEARDRGYDRVQLFTHAGNTRARRLYAGLGFTLTGRTTVSDHGEDMVHYIRPLTPARDDRPG